jgi:hypothetical protein
MERDKEVFRAMNRYRELMDLFPLSVQKLLVSMHGDKHRVVNECTAEEIHAYCDKMQEALDAEERRLYNLYKDFLTK